MSEAFDAAFRLRFTGGVSANPTSTKRRMARTRGDHFDGPFVARRDQVGRIVRPDRARSQDGRAFVGLELIGHKLVLPK
jgi:hypothetical protein